ncbi:ATP-binding protein [bacterium]|nr:ATP-binding protein [bacterium]MBU1065964.1 ATP-binding protein [bacterium]MBU1635524.1 ATP-binding protein [bacterium]MBU1874148.1 ATP-binding protein [bacterium]
MLIQFSVENFKSFKEEAVLSMVASSISENKEHVINDANPKLLRSAVVFGANASGKSNLIHAFQFMRNFILSSSKETQVNDQIPYNPFRLNTETENQPSMFEIIFLHQGIRYRYGFSIDDRQVHAEWLYYVKNVRELEVFTRDHQTFHLTSHFNSEEQLVKAKRIRPNALFLSVSAQFNGKMATNIFKWIKYFNIISGIQMGSFKPFTVHYSKDDICRKSILKFLKNADMNIQDIKINEVEVDKVALPPGKSILFKTTGEKTVEIDVGTFHKKYDKTGYTVGLETFSMDDDESAGTQKFFALSGPILDTLENGKVLVIDELDSRLHPRMLLAICAMFNSKKRNPHNAQLIFASHNTRILDNKLFRRDQIWFLEKNKQEESQLYSLVEFEVDGKKIRKDASYEKDYLRGLYGAVPMVRELDGGYGE